MMWVDPWRRRGGLAVGLTALIACRPGELPESVDGLVHHGWNTLESGSAEELAAVFLGLDHEVNVEKLEGEFEGELSRLTEEQAALAGVSRDASGAVGLFLSRDFDCDMASLVDVLTTVDQGALYPSGYEGYTRSYTTDRDSWDRGEEDFLRWNAQYTSSLIGATYTAEVDGLLRRVNGLDGHISSGGTGVISRLTLKEPADFEGDGPKEINFNFQLEFFYEREPGRMVHHYATWQQADMGAGVTTDDSAVQSLILGGMSSWDDRTEEHCEERML